MNKLQEKPISIPHASAGPDEPHVAGSTWSDTVLEKTDAGSWDSETNGDLNFFLNSPLVAHPKLHRGQLRNGLRYLILPNKVPANRYFHIKNEF